MPQQKIEFRLNTQPMVPDVPVIKIQAQHGYLVYTNESGQEYILRGGPSYAMWGPLKIEGANSLFPLDSHKDSRGELNANFLLYTGGDAEQKFKIAQAVGRKINANPNILYHAIDQNCNTFVYVAGKAMGLNVDGIIAPQCGKDGELTCTATGFNYSEDLTEVWLQSQDFSNIDEQVDEITGSTNDNSFSQEMLSKMPQLLQPLAEHVETINKLLKQVEDYKVRIEQLKSLIETTLPAPQEIQNARTRHHNNQQSKPLIVADVNPFLDYLVKINPNFKPIRSTRQTTNNTAAAPTTTIGLPNIASKPPQADSNRIELERLKKELAKLQEQIALFKQQLNDYKPQYFFVDEGQFTFNEEDNWNNYIIPGQFPPQNEVTMYEEQAKNGFSNQSCRPHFSNQTSSLVIGRGYDMGKHTASGIIADLTEAGLPYEDAEAYAKIADRTKFQSVSETELQSLACLTPKQQKRLFEITYKRAKEAAEDIYNQQKIDSNPNWQNLNPAIVELLTDYCYSGDDAKISCKNSFSQTSNQTSIYQIACGNDLISVIQWISEQNNQENLDGKRQSARINLACSQTEQVKQRNKALAECMEQKSEMSAQLKQSQTTKQKKSNRRLAPQQKKFASTATPPVQPTGHTTQTQHLSPDPTPVAKSAQEIQHAETVVPETKNVLAKENQNDIPVIPETKTVVAQKIQPNTPTPETKSVVTQEVQHDTPITPDSALSENITQHQQSEIKLKTNSLIAISDSSIFTQKENIDNQQSDFNPLTGYDFSQAIFPTLELKKLFENIRDGNDIIVGQSLTKNPGLTLMSDSNGFNILDVASVYGRKMVVQFLTTQLDDPFKMSTLHVDNKGETVLDKAIQNGHVQLCEFYLTNFSWKDKQLASALMTCEQCINRYQKVPNQQKMILNYQSIDSQLLAVISVRTSEVNYSTENTMF